MSHIARHLRLATVEPRSPGNTDVEAAFLRERLLLFARTWVMILVFYYILSNPLVHFEAAAASDWLVKPNNIALVSSIGLALAVWLGLRWSSPSERTPHPIAAGGGVSLCLVAALGSIFEPGLHDIRTTVLALTFTLIARSVMI